MKRYVKGSFTSGYVGIWWIINGRIIGTLRDLDHGYNDGNYIQYDKDQNHLTEWSKIVREQVKNNPDEIIDKGYKSLERGRVIYNLRTCCYEITCSKKVSKDWDSIQAIIEFYELQHCRYDIVSLDHYYVAEITGNPELDRFEYGA